MHDIGCRIQKYEDYMEYLQNLACGETLFYYHRVNHVLTCERAESLGFFDALFSNMGFFFFFLVIDVFTDMLE